MRILLILNDSATLDDVRYYDLEIEFYKSSLNVSRQIISPYSRTFSNTNLISIISGTSAFRNPTT